MVHTLVGKPAPTLTLPASNSEPFDLASVIGKGTPTAIFFFPKANTPVCDAEACSFERAVSTSMFKAPLNVIGISSGLPEELAAWKAKHSLSYPVLSDSYKKAREAYGAKGKLLMGASESRATFYIDGTGIVKGVLDGTLALISSEKHIKFIQEWETKETKIQV